MMIGLLKLFRLNKAPQSSSINTAPKDIQSLIKLQSDIYGLQRKKKSSNKIIKKISSSFNEKKYFEARAQAALEREEQARSLTKKHSKTDLKRLKYLSKRSVRNERIMPQALILFGIVFIVFAGRIPSLTEFQLLGVDVERTESSSSNKFEDGVNPENNHTENNIPDHLIWLINSPKKISYGLAVLCFLASFYNRIINPEAYRENEKLELIEYALDIYDDE